MMVKDVERLKEIEAELQKIEEAERGLRQPGRVFVGNALLDLSMRRSDLRLELEQIQKRSMLR